MHISTYTLYNRSEKGEKLFLIFFSKVIKVYSKVIYRERDDESRQNSENQRITSYLR